MIELNNLSKKYGSKPVLKNINTTFEKGKVYGIVGENGAGKTTLFRCISGLENYDGTITPIPKKIKNSLGLLLTDPFFFSKITGEEYLTFICNTRDKKINNISEKNLFELPLNQYASTYSTGMKKKLALLGILLQENDYFILDEPYNGVDIQSNILITEIILELKRLNKTVIISSHIFSTLEDTCDEIYLLEKGEITKKVMQADFKKLEEEMKKIMIGNKIEKLGLK